LRERSIGLQKEIGSTERWRGMHMAESLHKRSTRHAPE